MLQQSFSQKILVIDDSATSQSIIRSVLKDEPVQVAAANNGNDGLRLAKSEKPDLILLDVEMPAPDGFEVCRQLKQDPETLAIPIVFLTGASSTEQKVRGLDLGAVDYVIKPFDPAELCARVRASLRSKYMFDLLSHKAMIDGLTGIWNRAFFDQRLASEISLAKRHGTPFSLVMADVDKFKSINDSHGHAFGDRVLRAVSYVLSHSCRKEDIVCRYGGEEFAVLTPMTALGGAVTLAEHLRQAIAEQILPHRGEKVQVSSSFGVAELGSLDPATIVERADGALYQAKAEGRNRVVGANASATAAA